MKIKVLILSLFVSVALNAGDYIIKSSKNSLNDTVAKIEHLNPKALEKRFDLGGGSVIPIMTKTLDKITTKAGI